MLEFLKNAAKNGKLAHGYLFYGGTSEEMKNTAIGLADFLKTDQIDVHYITLEQGKNEISIDQIREIKNFLSLSPYNSLYKFVTINNAETMSRSATDALLKTLEEPQGNTILILITQTPDLLPKTIISRLQEIRFKQISLNKTAKDFINEEHVNILEKPLNDIFKYIEKITKQDDNSEIFAILDSWLFWFREKLIQPMADHPQSGDHNTQQLLNILKEIQKSKDMISGSNVNQRLVLENLILCINKY
jgi:DNA polymerase III delta prime subunit